MEYFYRFINKRIQFIFGLVFALVFIASCDKFESDQTVPAYIKIDSISVYTDFNTQGTASHNITDAWVYVDDVLIGAFELPCIVPVLSEGKHNLSIRAGIKLNGIATTRAPYPFYKAMEFKNIILTPDSVIDFRDTIRTTYTAQTKFAWMEDFQATISIVDDSDSDTTIIQTTDYNLVFVDPNVVHVNRSGLINLTSEKNFYEGSGPEGLAIPPANSTVMMEIDFKTDNVITTGLWVDTYSSVFQEAVLNLNTTSHWKKVYVNFTPAVQRNTDAYTFKAFIGTLLSNGKGEGTIVVDNIKLLYR